MHGFSLRTPEQVRQSLAARAKALRLAKGWKRTTLAERSGVSLASRDISFLIDSTRARESGHQEVASGGMGGSPYYR